MEGEFKQLSWNEKGARCQVSLAEYGEIKTENRAARFRRVCVRSQIRHERGKWRGKMVSGTCEEIVFADFAIVSFQWVIL